MVRIWPLSRHSPCPIATSTRCFNFHPSPCILEVRIDMLVIVPGLQIPRFPLLQLEEHIVDENDTVNWFRSNDLFWKNLCVEQTSQKDLRKKWGYPCRCPRTWACLVFQEHFVNANVTVNWLTSNDLFWKNLCVEQTSQKGTTASMMWYTIRWQGWTHVWGWSASIYLATT